MEKKLYALLFCFTSLGLSSNCFSQPEVTATPATAAPAASPSPATTAPTPATATTTAGTPLPPAGKQSTALETAAQVVWVKGTVKATYPDQAPRVLARGALIYEKDTLATAGDGSGEISFTDNSIVTLQANTTFVIDQYHFDQSKPSQGQYIMNLVKGGFRTITGFVAKAQPESYQVKTPVATIGVRGTDFVSSCPNNPGQCAFGLIHGAGIAVTNGAGTFVVTPQTPYATVQTISSAAVLTTLAPSILGKVPELTPPSAPPPAGSNPPPGPKGGGGGGNCGIIIN